LKTSKITYYYWPKLILLGLVLLVFSTAQAQIDLPIHIRENMTLSNGVYKVTGTHYVSKDATLTLNNNVTLLFEANATIRLDGGLVIIGKPNQLINITSVNPNSPGNGFVINGVSTAQRVDITYARFSYVKKPLTFEFRWSRQGVKVQHSVFKRSIYEGAAIEVKEHDNLLTPSKMLFEFKNNTFCNSTSSILISNITADLLTIDMDENVITRNEYTGRTRNGIFTSPLYFTYNQYQSNDVPNLQNNSIFDNYYSLFYDDKFDIGRTNLSVVGNADKLSLSNNYFGNPAKREIEQTFDFISANYQAPFLFVDQSLDRPPSYLNGHFYEVMVNNVELNEELVFAKLEKEIETIDLLFNRPVIDGKNFGVVYYYMSGDSIAAVPVDHKLKWTEGNQKLKIVITESLKKYGKEGYMEVDGLYDSDGKDVPALSIGKKALLDPKLRTLVNFQLPPNVTKKEDANVQPGDTLVVYNPTENTFVEFEALNDSFVHVRKKYWDYGFYLGNAVYFGDLNSSTVSVNPRNMRPSGGLLLGYQITEKWRVNLRNNYSLISGSDLPLNDKNTNPRGTGFKRNLSFRTFIADASLTTEYAFTRFKLKSSFVPSVFGGVNFYYFNPQNRVDGGQWVNLRDVGTGGQTINGDNRYKKVMVGIPYGASIKRHITQKAAISLSYTYNLLFTDYLDDVGVDPYPQDEALKAANPNLGPIAVTLSNPGNQKGYRSYSDKNDGYGTWGITMSFKIY
jgi:hypothetical protein